MRILIAAGRERPLRYAMEAYSMRHLASPASLAAAVLLLLLALNELWLVRVAWRSPLEAQG